MVAIQGEWDRETCWYNRCSLVILLVAQYPIRNLYFTLGKTALVWSSRKMATFLDYNG